MSHGKSDNDIINNTHNTARYAVETRHVTWVLLIAACLWGILGYIKMPQRKDPEFQVRVAVALTPWPGASAEKVEQLVSRRIEESAAGNTKVKKLESISRTGLSVVYFELVEDVKETGKEFDDIKLRLDAIRDLPQGAGPVNFMKDFGDTAALMLTVASPRVPDVELELRGGAIRRQIEQVREHTAGRRATVVVGFHDIVNRDAVRPTADLLKSYLLETGVAGDVRILEGRGFLGFDGASDLDEASILASVRKFVAERTQASDFHPDMWDPIVVLDPGDTQAKLAEVAGHRYSYRELDDFTDRIEKALKTAPEVSRVTRSGVLDERVYLHYSQARLASYGLQAGQLPNILDARNITLPGGQLSVGGKSVTIDPSGEFKDEGELNDVVIATSSQGTPVYLRNVAEIVRGYESPARFVNFYTWKDDKGRWHRDRAITLAVQMRDREQIAKFGAAVDSMLESVRKRLPEDLVISRTSDQPQQVRESVDLFMKSLYEAIGLVVLIALIGFWEWRSAVVMALSIPLTLAMTFGMMYALGMDIQQVSIAALIIALGLLVDDPVVAGDAIKRSLADGYSRRIAAWLGPTKLASAILYATVTNIVAYLPFLMLSGTSGEFLYSLPVVLACSLVASRLVSMTFIPLLGYYLLRPKAEPSMEERRRKGFAALYYRVGYFAITHRWKVLAASMGVLVFGGFVMSQLKTQYFPKDLAYLSYVDVWLPEDAPLTATLEVSKQTEKIVRQVAEDFGRKKKGGSESVLKSLTTFIGGGGPRFWYTVSPELQQLNYSQIIVQVNDKHDTSHLIPLLQRELSQKIAGARIDVRQLELGGVSGLPVAIRLSGEDVPTLRAYAGRIKNILTSIPNAQGVRDDWGAESFSVKLQTDADRANLAGVTNFDVAAASAGGLMGNKVTTLREGDKQIPVVARLRMPERAQLADVQNLYVYSSQGTQKVPLRQVSSIAYDMRTEKLRHRDQFRTITISAMPADETLPSEIMKIARPQLEAIKASLPAGYTLAIGGEEEEQIKSFKQLALVLVISVAAIFLALVFQFKNAVKPFIVFAAVPFGMVGALVALWIMGTAFGFMAFLGIVSLVGVIVSHIIVLFDFIEERHSEGAPLMEALLDAGIMRLRPVLITVAATVIALFPLASHGGPLWEPMCYAQIGGLTAATFITLLLVPVIYAITVLDLKLVKWDREEASGESAS
jgi:multidrug efflux pump subunit AcrB